MRSGGARPLHLVRRGAVYAARFRLPLDVARRVGVAEVQRSLNTRDFAEARRRCLLATRWFVATMEQMRVMSTPTREHLEAAARVFFDNLAADIDHPRGFPGDGVREAVAYNVHMSEERITALDRQLVANDFDDEADGLAQQMLFPMDVALGDLDASTGILARQLAVRAAREQMRYMIHALTTPARRFAPEDEVFAAPLSDRAIQGPSRATGPLPETNAGTLAEATAQFLGRKRLTGVGPSQIEETARLLEWLKQALGPDIAIASVTKAHLKVFRDDLQRIDVTLRGRAASFYDRLTDDPDKWVKSATYLRYWNTLLAFFGWTASELTDHNPAADLQIDKRRGEERRTPEAFDQAELKRLFQTPLYQGHKSRSRRSVPGDMVIRGAHWWSAVLLAFTGMRAGELSQLLTTDFVFDAEIPHIKIQRDDEDGERVKSTKNTASIRDVPIHPVLLTLGLRQFVEWTAKKYPKERLFWEFRLGGEGKYTDGITRFWRDYLTAFELKKPGRATHVWRHTVVDALRRQDVAEEDIQAVVGHKRRTITAGYGGQYPLARKAKTVALIDYGFDVVEALGGGFDPKRHRA